MSSIQFWNYLLLCIASRFLLIANYLPLEVFPRDTGGLMQSSYQGWQGHAYGEESFPAQMRWKEYWSDFGPIML